jgi:hypothetical protein
LLSSVTRTNQGWAYQWNTRIRTGKLELISIYQMDYKDQ